ncbi:MAG TPA: sigma-70 family RNA polymerase sigma factor [Ferruginibacter sp.]|nr:sigma-70 family RNA polymerase sigma factor [Ferruginibacter sp.]
MLRFPNPLSPGRGAGGEVSYRTEIIALAHSPHIEQTVEHLFRHEWGKLVSVLTKLFGPKNLQLAEDVVQDTLEKALHTWKIGGLPDNPSAWLFTAARNKAIDVLRRQKRTDALAQQITPLLQSEYSLVPTVHETVQAGSINDDQLRMMFVCCHPSLSAEAQVALILKTLCGFSVTEIAKSFLTGYGTIEKRLYRARQSFRDNQVSFDLPPENEIGNRLENVLTAIYLLFNEGYNSTQHEKLVREDLMQEAMRLCELICSSTLVEQAEARALLALMNFIASRNETRLDDAGNIRLLAQQDRGRWNKERIREGIRHLERSTESDRISRYHLEAMIAYEHAAAPTYEQTNWNSILRYYDLLRVHYPSPIVELNRAIAIGEWYGPAEGIKAIESILPSAPLLNYYLLPATLGEFWLKLRQKEKAIGYFNEAKSLTHSAAEKKLLQQKIDSLQQ